MFANKWEAYSWGSSGLKFIKDIGKKLKEFTDGRRSTFFLSQNIAMAIQRRNASCVMGMSLFWMSEVLAASVTNFDTLLHFVFPNLLRLAPTVGCALILVSNWNKLLADVKYSSNIGNQLGGNIKVEIKEIKTCFVAAVEWEPCSAHRFLSSFY